MFKRILIPFDGSPTAAAALPYASWFAETLKADVEVVTVAPSRAVLRGNVTTDVDDDDLGVSFLSQAARNNLEKAHGTAHERAESIAETVAASLRVEKDLYTVVVPGTLVALAFLRNNHLVCNHERAEFTISNRAGGRHVCCDLERL